jgi:hypothetical protein
MFATQTSLSPFQRLERWYANNVMVQTANQIVKQVDE